VHPLPALIKWTDKREACAFFGLSLYIAPPLGNFSVDVLAITIIIINHTVIDFVDAMYSKVASGIVHSYKLTKSEGQKFTDFIRLIW